jgi:Winged helix-turn helix
MSVFQALRYNRATGLGTEGLSMLTITNTTVARDEVWHAFRRTRDVRLRERYHCILLLMDGKSCPEAAQWLYRDEDTVRGWVHAFNQGGLQGLEHELIPGRPA